MAPMKALLARCLAIICLASLLFAVRAPLAAAEGGLCTPVLTPVDGPGFVALEALELSVTVACAAGVCTASSEQVLHLVNRDQVASAVVTLGIASCEATVASLTAANTILVTDGAAHTITLEPRAKADVTASVTASAPEGPLLGGEIRLTEASRWGAIENTHVELNLPLAAMGPDQAITPAPHRLTVDRAVWDWVRAPEDIAWAVLGPGLQRDLSGAIQSGDSLRIAELLASAGATDASLPAWRAIEPQILAALQSAIDAAPAASAPRLLLAQTYQALADQGPERRLNYLLLSLQQLDAIPDAAMPAADLAQRRSEALYQAALAAHAGGDPASALGYLNRAAELTTDERIRQAQSDFLLQWGLDLARQGQVAAAIAMMDEAGQLPVARELRRFAPPFRSARTRVTLAPQKRTASYELLLYEPMAIDTDNAIAQALLALTALPGVQVTAPTSASSQRQFSIALSFESLEQLHERRSLIVEALGVYSGLVTELVAAPWRGEVTQWGVTPQSWGRELVYAETTDTTAFQAAWQVDADYAGWWLVELMAQQPGSQVSLAAHELALLALREQTALWQALPDQAQWAFALDHPDVTAPPKWQVSSGQQRSLSYRQRWYDWQRAGQAALGLGLALVALSLAVALRRHRRARSGPS